MMNEFDEKVAKAALAIHESVGLDSRDDDETRLFHLLRSLLEYCDAQHPRIPFDDVLSHVRADFNEGKPGT